ncbi:unnamed protein product [Closterium sp. NIES-65]|nr:unnamed protein product [Closterium sp. NIES-65]
MPARRLPLRVRAGPVPPPFACPPHSSVLLLAPTASLASNAPSPSLLYAFLAASASRAKGISRPFSLRARGDCLADATPPPISLPACAADLANVSHPLPFPRSAATDQVSQTRQSVVYHVAHADQASATRPPASHHGADAPQASATLRSALLRAANADQVLLPYLRTKLHSLFAARQRQRQARALWVGEEDGGDDGWGGTGEEWGRGRDGGNNAGLGQGDGDGDGYGDGYGGAMGGEERSESGSSPGSMGSVGSLRGHEQLDDGLGTDGLRDETPGGEGVAAAAARVTDGRAEGGAGEEEADGQRGQVVTGGATAGNSDARGNGGRRSSAIGSSRSSARGSRRWRQVLRVLRWLQRRAVRGAAAAYPWVQAPYEGVCLLYQLLYVMVAAPHYQLMQALCLTPSLPHPTPLHTPGVCLLYQLLYVMDATPHYSPILHLLSLSLRRATPQELVRRHALSQRETHRPSPPTVQAEASSSISTRRQREFERLPGSPAIRAVQAALLKALYFTMDYAQTSVIAAVFAFKVRPSKSCPFKPHHSSIAAVFVFKMAEWWYQTGKQKLSAFGCHMAEWWYQTGEQKLSAPTVYPPPPPPPPPKASAFSPKYVLRVHGSTMIVAPAGIPLPADAPCIPVPADRSLCPLCLCRRTNPTAPATSGFIFCYPCIFAYVDKASNPVPW